MTKIRSKEEIGKFIQEKMIEKNLTQSKLAQKIYELMGGDNNLKPVDNVSKWINGLRYPGTEYIFYLSQALGVSIEEILVAGHTCEKYDNRPLTLYAVAQSGDTDMLDTIMTTMIGRYSVGGSCDEYGKCILDYIFKFDRSDLLEYMLKKQYISLDYFHTDLLIQNMCTPKSYFYKVMSYIISKDSVELFGEFFGRTKRIKIDASEYQCKDIEQINSNYGYLLSKELILQILNTTNIKQYLMTSFVPNSKEREFLNGYGLNQVNFEEYPQLEQVKTVSGAFNTLLNVALSEKLDCAKELLQSAVQYNKQLFNNYFVNYPLYLHGNEITMSFTKIEVLALKACVVPALIDNSISEEDAKFLKHRFWEDYEKNIGKWVYVKN